MAKYENLILVNERKPSVRVSPLPADQWDDAVDRALSNMPIERRNPEAAGNLVATLVRHPKLTRAFLRFNFHLLYGSTLPERLRELAVLRVAHRRHCEYEWRHHVRMGGEAGLTPRSSRVSSAVRRPTHSTARSSRPWMSSRTTR